MQKPDASDSAGLPKRVVFGSAFVVAMALAVLSVVGAFLGGQRAAEMFNSPPLAAFWVAVLVFLAAALVCFPRIRRRPASLAMHLGTILVLAGAMWGSQAGHWLAGRYLGTDKIRGGYMAIHEGEAASDVYDIGDGRLLGQLAFALGLSDFWIDYYPAESQAWRLMAESRFFQGGQVQWEEKAIDCSVGTERTVPWTKTRMKVLEYYRSARPIYADGSAFALRVFTDQGLAATVPAQEGKDASIENPKARIVIVRAFSRLLVRQDEQGKMEVVDAPAPPYNPAVQVNIQTPDGKSVSRYVYAMQAGMRGQDEGGLMLRLVPNEVQSVVADDSTHLPAMKLRFDRPDGRGAEAWLLPKPGEDYSGVPLSALLGSLLTPGEREVNLVLVKPRGPIRSFNSDVSVTADGKALKRQVIQVNHPMHYGGYHFYQHSYDQDSRQYTVLLVASDSGLWLVYAGMVLLTAGTVWHFWVRPCLRRLRRPTGNGD